MKTIFLCALLVSVCFGMEPTEIGKAIRKGGVSIEKRIDKIEEYTGKFGRTTIWIKTENGRIKENMLFHDDRGGYVILDTSFARLLIDKIFEPKEPEKMDSIRLTPWGTIQYVPDHMATDTMPGDK